MRWETIEHLRICLRNDLIPVVPAQGSVGASGDLAPLAHLSAALLGVGEFIVAGERVPANKALARAGLEPLDARPQGRACPFERHPDVDRAGPGRTVPGRACFQGGLRSRRPLGRCRQGVGRAVRSAHPRAAPPARSDRGCRALRNLIAGSTIRASHITNDDRVQDPYCLRCQPQVMGAWLDLLRQAAATLAAEANGVSDNPLVFADTREVISGGNFHAEPVAFAADMIAIALCEIGSIAERRVAMLTDPALSGLPAFLAPRPGLNSGFMIAQVTAAALVAENKQCAYPASVDSIPTSANQEDHVSMATHGARRLLSDGRQCRATSSASNCWRRAQGCDFHAPLTSSARLERVRACLRATRSDTRRRSDRLP